VLKKDRKISSCKLFQKKKKVSQNTPSNCGNFIFSFSILLIFKHLYLFFQFIRINLFLLKLSSFISLTYSLCGLYKNSLISSWLERYVLRSFVMLRVPDDFDVKLHIMLLWNVNFDFAFVITDDGFSSPKAVRNNIKLKSILKKKVSTDLHQHQSESGSLDRLKESLSPGMKSLSLNLQMLVSTDEATVKFSVWGHQTRKPCGCISAPDIGLRSLFFISNQNKRSFVRMCVFAFNFLIKRSTVQSLRPKSKLELKSNLSEILLVCKFIRDSTLT